MATKSDQLQPIRPDAAYPREAICELSGLGVSALRQAAREGALRQHFVSGRCFILGRDFIAWLDQYGKQSKDE